MLSFLALSLCLPNEDAGQLSLDSFAPYPGVPVFPEVSQADSGRASCFGRRSGGPSAPILGPSP